MWGYLKPGDCCEDMGRTDHTKLKQIHLKQAAIDINQDLTTKVSSYQIYFYVLLCEPRFGQKSKVLPAVLLCAKNVLLSASVLLCAAKCKPRSSRHTSKQ